MRILSYIDFYNQLYQFKKEKKKSFFFFFEKFYGQKWPTRMIPITSDYQFQDIFFMSD